MLFPAMKPNDGTVINRDKDVQGGAAAKVEPTKLYLSGADQTLPAIVGNFAGSQLETLTVDAKEAAKDKDLAKKHPSLEFPYIETQAGEVLF